jgi:hypothetical protein
MEGFLGIGIFSAGGELVSGVQEGFPRLNQIGDVVFEIIRRAGRLLRALDRGDCEIVEVTAKNGEHYLIRYFSIEGFDFLALLVCSADSDPDHFKRSLNHIASTLTEDLKVR